MEYKRKSHSVYMIKNQALISDGHLYSQQNDESK